jgi:hypothetical protein
MGNSIIPFFSKPPAKADSKLPAKRASTELTTERALPWVFVEGPEVRRRARGTTADLVDFKYRLDEGKHGGMTLRMVGTVVNKTSAECEGSIVLRLYDTDGFELHDQMSGKVRLTSRESDAATGDGRIDAEEWARITSLKVYVAEFGTADSPGEAISPVYEMRTQAPHSSR